jgi:hypothetical protein
MVIFFKYINVAENGWMNGKGAGSKMWVPHRVPTRHLPRVAEKNHEKHRS